MRRSYLKRQGTSETAILKREIQRLLREIGLIRDKGCVFREYSQSGACGGYRNDGELILQFDHLHSRVHAISFADTRLGVIACFRHHFHWKKQYPAEYEKLVRHIIGKERCKLLDMVREDRRPHRQDLKLELLALEMELERCNKN